MGMDRQVRKAEGRKLEGGILKSAPNQMMMPGETGFIDDVLSVFTQSERKVQGH